MLASPDPGGARPGQHHPPQHLGGFTAPSHRDGLAWPSLPRYDRSYLLMALLTPQLCYYSDAIAGYPRLKNVRITIPGPQRRDVRERGERERGFPHRHNTHWAGIKRCYIKKTYLDILKLKVRSWARVVLADIPGVHEALITVWQSPPGSARLDVSECSSDGLIVHILLPTFLRCRISLGQWSPVTPHNGAPGSKTSQPRHPPGPSRRCNHGWRIFWPPHIYICMWTGARPGGGRGSLDWRLLNWTFQTQHSIFQFASNILYFCGNTRMEPLYS